MTILPLARPPITWPDRERRRYVVTTAGTAHIAWRGSAAMCGADMGDWTPIEGTPQAVAAALAGRPVCYDCRVLVGRWTEERIARDAKPCRRCMVNESRRGVCRTAVALEDLTAAAYNRFLRLASVETFRAQRRAQATLYAHIGQPLPPLNEKEVLTMMTLDPIFAVHVAFLACRAEGVAVDGDHVGVAA